MVENSKLPGYLIDSDGSVFYKKNQQPVEAIKGLFRVQTDETVFANGKMIKLVRRLSKDELKKYYHSSSSFKPQVENDDPGYTHVLKIDLNKSKKAPKNGRAVVIDGKEYKNASEAANCLKTSVNTVINRCKNNKFTNYNFL